MRTRIKNLFALPALVAFFCFAPAGRLAAQTFTTLHSFSAGGDGANPYAGLILSGTTLQQTQPCLGPNPCPCAYMCVSGVWTEYAQCRDCF